MKLKSVFFISVFMASASANCGDIPFEKIKTAIKSGDEKTFNELIPNNKDFFAPKGALAKAFNSSGSYLENPDAMGSLLLSCAVGSDPDCKNISCNKSVVRKLIEAGAKVTEGHINAATSKPCSEVSKVLLENANEEDVASSGIWFFDYIINWTMGHSLDQQINHQEEITELLATASIYHQATKKANCSDQNSTAKVCQIYSAMKKAFLVIENQSKNFEFQNSAEGLSQKRCELLQAIRNQEASLKKEKSIAATAGVQNNVALYAAGKKIVELNEQAEDVEKNYKRVSGKTWTSNLCK